MIGPAFRRFLAFAGAALALSGCARLGLKAPMAGRQPNAGPVVSVDVRGERVRFWAIARAGVEVRNVLARPVALLAVELRTADGALVCRGGAETASGTATDDGAVIEGTLLIDDPGPMARVKFPDRWEWKGDTRLVHFPVLRPGRSFTATGSFRVTHQTGNCLRATARFVELGDEIVLLGKTKRAIGSIPLSPTGTFGRGWVPTRRMTVTFGRATKVASLAHMKDSWAERGVAASLPTFYLHALLEADYKALETKQHEAEPTVHTFDVEGPPLPLAKARKQTGVASGPCTYFPARSAWVLEAGGTSLIVGPAVNEKHAGSLVALIDAFTGRGKAELTLFDDAKAQDPGGHVAFLTGKGLAARSRRQKAGTYRGTVEVTSSDLGKLLPALKERGLRVDGLKIQ